MTISSKHASIIAGVAAGLGFFAALAVRNSRKTKQVEQLHPPEGAFVTIDGVKLHYLERSSARDGDATIVLIHGNGAMAEDFALSGLLDRLAAAHRVIAFDRPGFGHSPRPRLSLWTARRQARLLHAAMEGLDVNRPIVVGHSWGTLVALNLALDYPNDIRALALLSGYYFPSARADVALSFANAIPLLGDLLNHTIAPLLGKAMSAAAARKIFAPRPVPARFTTGFPMDLALRPQQLRATSQDTALMIPAAQGVAPHYDALTLPVTIIAGDGDAIVDTHEQSERLAQAVGQSVLRIIPGAGHMVHYAAPETIAAAIEDLASERPAPAAAELLAGAQAVIFDIDGTLLDSVDLHAEAWQEALRDFGHDVGFQAIRHQIGKGGDQLMPVFLSETEVKEQGKALEQHRSALFMEKYLPRIISFPAVRALFERLHADGKQLVLASSAKADEIELYKEIAGITDLVDAEVAADDVKKSKPHPDVFESALATLSHFRAAEVIAIGDTPYDAEAAGKAGLRTIGVLCGGFAEADLVAAGCAAIERDPATLLSRYQEQTARAA
jgi:HAD superfamily hydrolase (TIGR01509 family)